MGIDVSISMGAQIGGGTAGFFEIAAEEPSPTLATPESLRFSGVADVASGVSISYSGGNISEVEGPDGSAEVNIINTYKYEIIFHDTNSVEISRWTIENPDASPSVYNRLKITETPAGGSPRIWMYTYTSGVWTLTTPGNLSEQRTQHTVNATTGERTEIFQYANPGGSVIFEQKRIYSQFIWGEGLTSEIIGSGGDARTTTYAYYADSSEAGFIPNSAQAPLKYDLRPDGTWNYYQYDTNGRIATNFTGFLNQSVTNNASLCTATVFAYAGVNTNDDGTISPQTARTEIQYVLGTEVGRRYRVIKADQRLEILCQTAGAAWNASDNLVTTNTYFSSGDFEGALKSVGNPDGTMSIYEYSKGSDGGRTNTVFRGAPNGTGTAILSGSKTVTRYGAVGELLSEESFDIASNILTSRRVSSAFDAHHRAGTVTYLNGRTETYDYDCCNLNSFTDQDGTTTTYVYDALKRRTGATKNGILQTNRLDAAGQTLWTVRVGTNGTTNLLYQAAYDTSGFKTRETNAVFGVTVFSEGLDGNGQLVITNVYPNTGTRYEKRYKDGRMETVTGTAVNPVKFEYGVIQQSTNADYRATFEKEIKLDSAFAATSEVVTNFMDFAGRPYKTVWAAASAPYPTSTQSYNAKGQLSGDIDADGVRRLYLYNAEGTVEYEIADLANFGTADFAGTDRITQRVSTVATNASVGANVVRQEVFVWGSNGVNASNRVSTMESSVNGLTNWSIIWNGSNGVTNKSEKSYPGGTTTRVTSTMPNGATTVSDSIGGRTQSVTEKNSSGSQVTKVSYLHDAHGRVSSRVDARNGATTFTYNNADQQLTETTPLPGTGAGAQTVSTLFDEMGRPWKVTQPDGTVVTNEYTLRGEPKKSYGSRNYPWEQTYEAQGRKATLKTWQNFAGNSGTAMTYWYYDVYRGWLTNKMYGTNQGPKHTYTAAGRLASRIWARGITTSYTPDNAGKPWKIAYSDGTTPGVTNTYDRAGRLWQIEHNGTVTTNLYNGAGILLGEFYVGGTLGGLAVTNDYDSYLRRSSTRVATYDGTINAYTYDSANRLATVGDGTISATYSYLANSRLVSQILYKQNSDTRMTTAKQYDRLNRLQSIVSTPSGTNSTPFAFFYGLNDANQRVRVNNGDGTFWIYGYDALGQVTSGKKYWNDGVPIEGQQHEFGFDDIGNRKTTKEGGNYLGQNLRSASYTNNLLNQITGRGVPSYEDIVGISTSTNSVTINGSNADYRRGSYFREEMAVSNSSGPAWTSVTVVGGTTNTGNILTPPLGQTFGYDADGNLTNDLVWRYIWDGESRLIEIQSLTNNPSGSKKWLKFAYDSKGRRISKWSAYWTNSTWQVSVNNRFVYDGWNYLGELNATNNNLIRGYIWGSDLSGSIQGAGGVGGLIAANDAAQGSHFYAFDGNGNVVGTVKTSDGSVSSIYEYAPFGQIIRATGSFAAANPICFSTKYWDSESSLYYYGFRYYASDIGSWLSRDPIGEEGGENLYGFVGNATPDFVDPIGFARRRWRDRDFWRGWSLSLFDERGKELLGRWLDGGFDDVTLDGENWQSYIKANKLLPKQLREQLVSDAQNRWNSGSMDTRFYAEIENGYFTGYEMLHGSNPAVGNMQIKGWVTVRSNSNGNKTLTYNVTYTWHDIIDPNPQYSGDVIASWILHLFYSPKDYTVHIPWQASSEVTMCGDHFISGSGYPFE